MTVENIYQPHLKICGVTNVGDVRLVGDSGADYCGILVDVDFSERSLGFNQAKEVAAGSKIPVIILMCDPSIEAAQEIDKQINPYAVQLLCRETPIFVKKLKRRLSCKIWKTLHLPPAPDQASPEAYIEAGADALLVDSMDTSEGFMRFGGTGKIADWKSAASMVEKVAIPVFLAGGIDPHNVSKALMEVRPFGIDLCTGVEASKGKKDPEKMDALVNNFRKAATQIRRGAFGPA